MEVKSDPLRFKKRPQVGLLIENARGEVLLQLRDNKPEIPYPGCWGTFGGQIEEGELPEQAVIREIREELGYSPPHIEQYGIFPCDGYDIYMFRCVDTEVIASGFQIREGQAGCFFSCADLNSAQFAFNCREILEDYFKRFHREETVSIGLGSNLGDREQYLKQAIAQIKKLMPVSAVSSIYETEPVGYADQGWFLNMALQGRTRLFPQVLLERLQHIEAALGRLRGLLNGPRTIDLDMLLYGKIILDSARLVLPHPELHKRAFVLVPLAEIAPDFEHPVLHRTISFLLQEARCSKKIMPYHRAELQTEVN